MVGNFGKSKKVNGGIRLQAEIHNLAKAMDTGKDRFIADRPTSVYGIVTRCSSFC